MEQFRGAGDKATLVKITVLRGNNLVSLHPYLVSSTLVALIEYERSVVATCIYG